MPARVSGPSMADVIDAFDELSEAAKDLTPVWPKIGRLYERHTDSVFASSGNGQWGSFASATLLRRKSPLVREGIMRDGLTLATPRHGDHQMAAYGPKKRNYRVQNVAILNQVGHRDRAGKMVPPRPIKQGLTAPERENWVDEVRSHLREAMPGR